MGLRRSLYRGDGRVQLCFSGPTVPWLERPERQVSLQTWRQIGSLGSGKPWISEAFAEQKRLHQRQHCFVRQGQLNSWRPGRQSGLNVHLQVPHPNSELLQLWHHKENQRHSWVQHETNHRNGKSKGRLEKPKGATRPSEAPTQSSERRRSGPSPRRKLNQPWPIHSCVQLCLRTDFEYLRRIQRILRPNETAKHHGIRLDNKERRVFEQKQMPESTTTRSLCVPVWLWASQSGHRV